MASTFDDISDTDNEQKFSFQSSKLYDWLIDTSLSYRRHFVKSWKIVLGIIILWLTLGIPLVVLWIEIRSLRTEIKTSREVVINSAFEMIEVKMSTSTETSSPYTSGFPYPEQITTENDLLTTLEACQCPPGMKGDTGVQGPPGIKGEVGLPGLPGFGIKGDTGNKGLKGEVGFAGQTGISGAPGLTGPIGLKGQKGEVGNSGINGRDGAAGVSGGKGQKGSKGETGLRGENGAPGMAGEKGEQGVRGKIFGR